MSEPGPGPRLGTFLGVFTPSILTILGVVLYLRTGWVVGQVGLVPALLIVVLAHVITVATALSVSAVATNMAVGAGGAYYMISRSLGLEIGGAIGIPLFLAQTFSLTLYAFGFAEALAMLWPSLPGRETAAATIVVVALVASRSADFALKLQIPIMALIGLSLLSLVVGALRQVPESLPLFGGVEGSDGFWAVFAVFFPAVTGLMAGVSLSGDLADPKRSIPRGTILAVLVGFVIYLLVPILLAVARDPVTLATDHRVWFDVAWIPWLIFPGLLGAILSSAVGSILAAPRTLEALAEDRVLPRPPARFLGFRVSRPFVAHAVATGVSLAAVLLGDLNAVAPVLTMFFLTTYGMVNLVAGLEQLSGAPSYRPTIRVPWIVSLGGAASCIWVMSLIHPLAAAIAFVVELLIYFGLRRRALSASWGDLRYGALMSLARAALLQLRRLPVDPRNWRPHILVFAGDPRRRLDLLRFASWLNQRRGILTYCRLLVGDLEEHAAKIEEETRLAHAFLESEGIVAFAETEVVPALEEGILAVCQANGIAGISSNTIFLGWSDDPGRAVALLRVVRRAALLGKSSVLCRTAPRGWAERFRRIDVWWGGLEHNGDMLLLFAYLVSVNPEWSAAKVTVKTIATPALPLEETEQNLRALIDRCRIKAATRVLERSPGASVQDVIHAESRDADVVLLGLQEPRPGDEEAYRQRLESLIGDLPTVLLVRAAGPFAGRLL